VSGSERIIDDNDAFWNSNLFVQKEDFLQIREDTKGGSNEPGIYIGCRSWTRSRKSPDTWIGTIQRCCCQHSLLANISSWRSDTQQRILPKRKGKKHVNPLSNPFDQSFLCISSFTFFSDFFVFVGVSVGEGEAVGDLQGTTDVQTQQLAVDQLGKVLFAMLDDFHHNLTIRFRRH